MLSSAAARRGRSTPMTPPPLGPLVTARAPSSTPGSTPSGAGEDTREGAGSPLAALLLPLLILSPLGLGCSTPAGPPTSPTPAAREDPPKGEDESGDARGAKPPLNTPEATSDDPTDDRPAAEPEPELDPIDALRQRTPRCSDPDKHCFGVHLHIVVDEDGVPVQTLDWVSAQLAGAQDRFMTSVHASFEVVAVDTLPSDQRDIVSRIDRDKLGRPHFSRGVVHIFIVGSLADVDNPGEIRGVHWRDRSNTARRWVILSSIAGTMTLTHELGHFFSLPHSTYADSLMNKRPGGRPFAERGFHPKEATRMRRAKATMLADKMLTTRPVSSSETELEAGAETDPPVEE